MKIKLLTNIFEKDRHGNDAALKVTIRKNRSVVIPWVTGTVVEMSDESAAKFIERGQAEAVAEQE